MHIVSGIVDTTALTEESSSELENCMRLPTTQAMSSLSFKLIHELNSEPLVH